MLIGLGHYSRVGKDTLCRFIISAAESRGVTVKRDSFADRLKEVAHHVYGWAGLQPGPFYEVPQNEYLRDSPTKIGLTPVEIWIKMGCKLREIYLETWVDIVMQNIFPGQHVVIPDVRFPNEAAAIKAQGGLLVKVVRPGYGPRKNSEADKALLDYDGWDYTVGETGQLTELLIFAEQLALGFSSGRWPNV